MYRLFLFLLVFGIYFLSFEMKAQSDVARTVKGRSVLDSLWCVYDSSQTSSLEDTAQINRLLEISNEYLINKSDSSQILAEIAIRQSEENLYSEGKAKAFWIIGLYYQTKNYSDSAVHFFRSSSSIYKEIQDSVHYSLVLNNLAGVYYAQGNYERALKNLLASLRIQQHYNDELQIARALNNMALIYKKNSQYEKSIQMHKQAILIKEKLRDSLGIATSYLNIGSVFLEQESYEKAVAYFEKGLPMALKTDNDILICQYYINLGMSLINTDSLKNTANKDQILLYFDKAEIIAQRLTNKQFLFYINFGRGQYFFYSEDYIKALSFCKKALKLEQEVDLRKGRANIYRFLSRIYKQKNQFESSTFYLEKYANLDDSLKKEENLNEIKRLQAVFESERQEQIISVLREQKKLQDSEIKRQEIWNYSLASGAILLLVIAILVFIQKRDRDNQNKEILKKSNEIGQQKEKITQQNIKLKETFSRLSILSEIGRKITATMDENALISIIKESIEHIMPVDGVGIGIYNPRSQAIEYSNFIEKDEVLPFHIESATEETKSLSVQSFLEDKEIFIVDIKKEYFQKNQQHINLLFGEVPQTAFFIPLRIREHPIGIMTIQSFKKNPYTEDNLALLRNLSTYVSIAVANANAYKLIRDKNQNILDSMRYAKTIQGVLTPTEKSILNQFSEYCLIYSPKDIVSGDFYWLTKVNDYTFIAVVDCTGHGIPGAFMSMIGNMLLDELINQEKHMQPSKILKLMHERIRKLLKQDVKPNSRNSSKSNKDGMDMILCRIKKRTSAMYEVAYSGAKRPFWYADPSYTEIQEIGATRQSIGGKQREAKRLFEEDIIQLPAGSSLYLTTDGFADQNSPQAERIGSYNLKLFLNKILDKNMATQQDLLIDFLEAHTQDAEQRDDITFWGVKLD
ncbi:serine phosphatase RsbU, regulator of sigma subunit [Bernardetia litoralis DSM 6794]|uniref:Serine phosphatase RsbU, regulator of sigma subunit n=1 Tax=Bernardetia litoralis (strain ATCC 23117 / DSM 6794 / NBRC 15988 / NCIMB 1366 / Fx l1 / Sio-4) TaxID=880071 RepID=I4AJF2_BERLS|nr:tetratricopeptide repeat protein [Bernardetia litoralis]AFM04087.1 serine phosphatase RsbU, regulator of sigma subunit [Bernardetia litoralis DSM 6794]